MKNIFLQYFNFTIFNSNQQIIALVLNIIVILFTIVFCSFFERNKVKDNILQGLIIGILVSLLINIPVVLTNGSYYDAKTIIYTLGGYFFGPITSIVAVTIGVITRSIVPEVGNPLVSIVTIISSTLIGYLMYKMFNKVKVKFNKIVKYTILSYIVNIINIFIFLLLSITGTTFKDLIIPYLVVFPVVTVVASLFLNTSISYYKLIRQNLVQTHLLKTTVDAINKMGLVTIDTEFKYLFYNKIHEDYVLNYLNKKIKIGSNYIEVFSNTNHYIEIKEIIESVFKGERFNNKYIYEYEDMKIHFDQEYVPIYDKGRVVAINIITKDITEQKEFEEEMINLSYRDALTGVYNRRSLSERIKSMNYNNNIVIIFFDIDGLKFMNDAFGHEDGDKLIILIVKEIRKSIPEKSLIFRLGGDEFVVMIQDVNLIKGKQIAKKISSNLSKQKINEIEISISYGVANKLENEHLEDTIKRAEDYMYDNKILFSRNNHVKNIDGILKSLLDIDIKLEQHIANVYRYSSLIADEIKLDDHNKKLLKPYILLHDIGKISIDKDLVAKEYFETQDEVYEMKKHVEIGYRILSRVPDYFEIAFDVLTQYENFDGTGYPKNLKGNNIPIKARILRIANYYDFKVNYEDYSEEEALKYIIDSSGKRFDPELVKAFVKAIKK